MSRFVDTGERLLAETPLLFKPEMARAVVREAHPKIVTRRLHKGEAECPYGTSGDRIWGKETYRLPVGLDGLAPGVVPYGEFVRYEADGEVLFCDADGPGDIMLAEAGERLAKAGTWGKLRPSIFMCRWMSRLRLTVTETWEEPLHAITDEEAMLEGIEQMQGPHGPYFKAGDAEGLTPVLCYQALWEQINGAGSWSVNPQVWRIGFRLAE